MSSQLSLLIDIGLIKFPCRLSQIEIIIILLSLTNLRDLSKTNLHHITIMLASSFLPLPGTINLTTIQTEIMSKHLTEQAKAGCLPPTETEKDSDWPDRNHRGDDKCLPNKLREQTFLDFGPGCVQGKKDWKKNKWNRQTIFLQLQWGKRAGDTETQAKKCNQKVSSNIGNLLYLAEKAVTDFCRKVTNPIKLNSS